MTALWPARAGTRRAYAQSLAQRNALLTRIRAGRASQSGLESWDLQLARHGITLMADRARAMQAISDLYSALAQELGLEGGASAGHYRPRSAATSAQDLAAELAERRTGDLDRSFTGHGPHRDDVVFQRGERDLRAYGSQGQQRLGLLTLLLAERDAIAAARDSAPLMLLDDVMSELDHVRREALVALLRTGPRTVGDHHHRPRARPRRGQLRRPPGGRRCRAHPDRRRPRRMTHVPRKACRPDAEWRCT